MNVNRRAFLRAALAAAGGGYAATRAGAAPPQTQSAPARARDAPLQKLILSAPLTHSDWALKPGILWGAEGVRHMLDACKACGWSRVYWRALDGGRALYKSRLVRPENKWDEDSFWSPQTDADKETARRFTPGMTPDKREETLRKLQALDYEHFDSLAAAVGYGHKIGLQIHAWVSINEDDHGWGLRSDFSKNHPGLRWVRRDGRPYHSQLSFAFPEVRAYKLAILDELLTHYEIDGLFLDWIRTGDVRDNPQTDASGVADSGYEKPLADKFLEAFEADPTTVPNADDRWVRLRAEPQTEFMRGVRKLIGSRRRKVPVCALVGHPWHYRGLLDKIDGNLRGLLLDVRTWSREGLIDAAVAAGYYRDGGTPEAAWRALRDETEGRVDVWSYAWVPQTPADFDREFDAARTLGAKQILFWEADYIDDRPDPSRLKAAMAARAAGL